MSPDTAVERGDIWWADLPEPQGSGPGFRRPVLVIQADSFNRSRIQTVVVAVLTSNRQLAAAPGNVIVPARFSGLPKDSVVNMSQIFTLTIPAFMMVEISGQRLWSDLRSHWEATLIRTE